MKLEEAIKTNKFFSEKQKAGLNILYTAWWLKASLSKELKNLGITHEQYNVLRILKGTHPEKMCVKDIGCRMIEPSSNVPRIIDRLVYKKLVERSNSLRDKRETVILLTDSGIEVLDEATLLVNKMFKSEVILSDENALQLNTLLETLREKQ